jgi:hypothetical protein
MPRSYPPEIRQVIELARSGTRVAQLSATFGMSEASIYKWLTQEKIDRGEIHGVGTDQALSSRWPGAGSASSRLSSRFIQRFCCIAEQQLDKSTTWC